MDEQGIDNDLQLSNPYSWINDFEDVSNEQRYFANLSLTYDLPIDGLSYRLRIGGNSRTKERRRFYGLTTFQGSSTNGSLGVSEMLSQSYQVNNLLQFKKTYKYRHRFNGVLGITYDVRDIENERYEVNNFSTLVFRSEQPQYAQDVRRPVSNTIRKTEMLSFLGRLNYSYKNQYIFTGSLRVDGSSKFVDENRYGFFPSFSFAWNMKRANFLIDNDFVSQLKMRAGWGQIGSQGISAYQTSEELPLFTEPILMILEWLLQEAI